MTIYYVDLENGNDSNDGLSFANRKKTVGGLSPSAGDVVRIMASLDPQSLGVNGTWEDSPNIDGGAYSNLTISGSTNATPPVFTTSTAHGYSTGDTVVISNTVGSGMNGVWEITVINSTDFSIQRSDGTNPTAGGVGTSGGQVLKLNNRRVLLASALTKDIALCEGGIDVVSWTLSANVSQSFQAGLRCSGGSMRFDIASGFTTGKAAYRTIIGGGTQDLSGYQQLCFWVRNISGTINAGDLSLCLCSDATGDTVVNTFDVPVVGASSGSWKACTVDLGGPMGSSIQSIALYVNVDQGAISPVFDNIFAAKAKSSANALTINDLIGKNTSEPWWPIMSITNKRVILDTLPSSTYTPNQQVCRGYVGTSETVAAYRRAPIQSLGDTNSVLLALPAVNGTPSNKITYSGGWNRTDMSTQTGDTFIDGLSYLRYVISPANNYLSFEHLSAVRGNTGWYIATAIYGLSLSYCGSYCSGSGYTDTNWGADFSFTNYISIGSSAPFTTPGARVSIDTMSILGSAGSGLSISQARHAQIKNLTVLCCNGNGLSATDGFYRNLVLKKNTTGLSLSTGGVRIDGLTTSLNINGGVFVGLASNSDVGLKNWTHSDTTPYILGNAAIAEPMNSLYVQNEGAVADADVVYQTGGSISKVTDQRNTASGFAWRFNPTSTSINVSAPLFLVIAKILCQANVQKTLKIWTRRDNTNIVGQMVVRGLQLAGLDSDTLVSCAPTINTWVQSSALTFTPTETGVVEVEFQVYDGVGTTNSFWIDDLAVA